MATRTLPIDSDLVRSCPVLAGPARKEHDEIVRASKQLTKSIGAFLKDRADEEKVAWLKTAVEASRPIFQPWVMEILFVTSVLGTTRFNELHALLGLSTRTLSDKLRLLQDEGLVERIVHDEQPVRIEYKLTKEGWATVAVATPLFSQLNLLAIGKR